MVALHGCRKRIYKKENMFYLPKRQHGECRIILPVYNAANEPLQIMTTQFVPSTNLLTLDLHYIYIRAPRIETRLVGGDPGACLN